MKLNKEPYLHQCYFSICSKNLDLHFLTKELLVKPTRIYKLGDKLTYSNAKKSSWEIGNVENFEIDMFEEFDKQLSPLYSQKLKLIKLKKKFNLEYMLMVVLRLYSLQTPAFIMPQRMVHFLGSIGAEIHGDFYNSYMGSDSEK
jgi:hypothetical protein